MSELAVQESVTTGELTNLTELIRTLRDEESTLAAAKSQVSKRLELAEQNMIELLEKAQLTNFRSDAGMVTITHRTSVKLPKSPEDWLRLKEHLIAEGLEDRLTVGSQWLNGYYKSRVELAKEGHIESPDIPGAGDVTISQTLSLRK